jgi:hypothetical protein
MATAEFKVKTVQSFAAIRSDMDEFKASMNDWIIFLDRELRMTRMHVRQLQKRLEQMETRQQRGY